MPYHNQFLKWVADQIVDAEARVILLDTNFTPNVDTQDFYSDIIANEVSGQGYSAGGVVLPNEVVTRVDASDEVRIGCDDIILSNTTIVSGARAYIIWTGNAATSPVIWSGAWPETKTTANSNFEIQTPVDLFAIQEGA